MYRIYDDHVWIQYIQYIQEVRFIRTSCASCYHGPPAVCCPPSHTAVICGVVVLVLGSSTAIV